MAETRCAKITDPDRIRNYLTDESAAFHGRADALYLPADEADVVEVMRAANASHTPLTISAGGTSLTGSRVPTGGAVLSVERMAGAGARPREGFERVDGPGFSVLLNREDKIAVVPPAVTLSGLDAALARFGLLYPPDPTEMSAMIGGTVATNASGARSFHYGPTRAWVRRLRLVLPTGEVADVRRGGPRAKGGVLRVEAEGRTVDVPLPGPGEYEMPRTKNAAGLLLEPNMEPIDLFIGSEGLLGVVTEVEVNLAERVPQTLTVVAYFNSRDDALELVDSIVSGGGARGHLCVEYFDARALDFMRQDHPDVPEGTAGAILFELPYHGAGKHNPYPPSDLLRCLQRELQKYRALLDWAVPGSRREDIRLFRHSLPEAVNEYVRGRVGKIGSDMAVPHDRLREMMDAYERESAASGVRFLVFGHIGEAHVHLNYLPENDEEAERAKAAYSRLARIAVGLGGTISAEHGVGKKVILDERGCSVPYLQVLYGERGLRAIANVKRALDPGLILNIGNMVPAEMLR